MTRMDYERLIDEVTRIAHEAGDKTLEFYHRLYEVTDKEDQSPLTEADTAAHATIHEALSDLEPELPVLSEEGQELADRQDINALWVVDPLDGTKEFIQRNGEFTVNIALVEDGTPTLGVVHAPALGITYAGFKQTAYTLKDGERRSITTQVGRDPAQPTKVVASRSHRDEYVEHFLQQLGEHEITSVGSSLKLCAVAEGEAHVYPRFAPTMEWDTAAGDAIVRAAGGGVYQLNGEPLLYNKLDLYNPFFVAAGADAPEWQSLVSSQLS